MVSQPVAAPWGSMGSKGQYSGNSDPTTTVLHELSPKGSMQPQQGLCLVCGCLCRLPSLPHRLQPLRHTPHVPRAANSSFDAEEDLDAELAEELSRFRSPDTWNKVAQHLDLVWKIGRVSRRASSCRTGTPRQAALMAHAGRGGMAQASNAAEQRCSVCAGNRMLHLLGLSHLQLPRLCPVLAVGAWGGPLTTYAEAACRQQVKPLMRSIAAVCIKFPCCLHTWRLLLQGRTKRSVCGCCQGTGEEECSWCHGTGQHLQPSSASSWPSSAQQAQQLLQGGHADGCSSQCDMLGSLSSCCFCGLPCGRWAHASPCLWLAMSTHPTQAPPSPVLCRGHDGGGHPVPLSRWQQSLPGVQGQGEAGRVKARSTCL